MLSGLTLPDGRYHVVKDSPNASIFLSKFPELESEDSANYIYSQEYGREHSDELNAIAEALEKTMPDYNPAQNLGYQISQLYKRRDEIQAEINQHKYHCDEWYPDSLDDDLSRNFDLIEEAEKQMETLKGGSWKRDPETCEWVFTNA